jgi:hypothetical protein
MSKDRRKREEMKDKREERREKKEMYRVIYLRATVFRQTLNAAIPRQICLPNAAISRQI